MGWGAHRRQYLKTDIHAAMAHLWPLCSEGHLMCTGLCLELAGLLQARVGMLARGSHHVLPRRLAARLIQRHHMLRVRACMPQFWLRGTSLGQPAAAGLHASAW